MNNQHIKGKLNELKGKVRENIDHVTGDTKGEMKGIREQIKGKVEKRFADAKDAIKQSVDSRLNRDKSQQ